MLEPVTEFLKRPGLPRMRCGYFDALQKMKGLEGQAPNLFRIGPAILVGNAEQIGAEFAEGEVGTDVGRGQLLGKHGRIQGRQNPLSKFIGKTFGKEMVPAQALESMVED